MVHHGAAIAKVEALCNAHFLVKSAFGPVPIELDEMYPNSQSLVPEQIDLEVLEASEVFARHFLAGAGYEFGVLWEGDATLAELENRKEDPKPLDWPGFFLTSLGLALLLYGLERTAHPEEREQLKHFVPYIEQQQTLTKREIPIVVLERG